jgi:glycosyltransferase involved in cell wall biosynthesis
VKISVVTAVYNGAATIEQTLQSVAGQSHPDIEHILVDGASTDGTLEVVHQSGCRIAKVISEPDRGVYEAMNKGVAAASGEIVAILNADDWYSHRNALDDIARCFDSSAVDICYSDIVYVRRDDPTRVVRYWRAGPYDGVRSLARGWYPPHSGFFARRALYERLGPFSPAYPLAGDVELMIRFLKHATEVRYLPKVVTRMRLGGISNARFSTVYRQNVVIRRALRHNGIEPENLVSYSARKLARRFAQFVTRPNGA